MLSPMQNPRLPDFPQALGHLLTADLVHLSPEGLRTSQRWQGAMARTAVALMQQNEDGDDLRVPIVHVLVEIFADELGEDELCEMTAIMCHVESRMMGFSDGVAH